VRALKLAKSGEADYLPGWCGPIGRMINEQGP